MALPIVTTQAGHKEVQQQESNTLMPPNESGRCPYCGSEEIEEYYDSTAECHEGRRARRPLGKAKVQLGGSKRKANVAQGGTGDVLINPNNIEEYETEIFKYHGMCYEHIRLPLGIRLR